MSFKPETKSKLVLVILAHPDDETAMGAALANYAVQNKVYYIVATDGRYGTRANKIAEDTLINIRKAECECSCSHLGIDSLIMLGFHDGIGVNTGIGEYFRQSKKLKETLKEKILEINPDFIITFGPDGDTGHGDHRIIGDITTEIILEQGWYERFPIYYMAWSKEQDEGEEVNYVDSKYFNVTIRYEEEDEKKAIESIKCYKSQNTPEEIEDWVNAMKKDTTNVSYFRKLAVATGNKSGFSE